MMNKFSKCLLTGVLSQLALLRAQEEISVDFNTFVTLDATLQDTLVFAVGGNVDSIVLFNEGEDDFETECEGGDVGDVSTVVADVEDGTATVDLGDLGLDDDVLALVFGQLDNGDCIPSVFAIVTVQSLAPTESPTFLPTESPTLEPTFSPTLTPTDLPTLSPTASPVERLDTLIPWNNPNDLQRFSGAITLTANEQITFSVLNTHNLIEFPDRQSFLDCDFSAIPDELVLVNGVAEDASVLFDEVGRVRWFGCNLTTPENLTHCEAFGQKIAVDVVTRGAPFSITWAVPANDAERALFETPTEILVEQPISFVEVQDELTIRQFNTKEAFDNCQFNADLAEFILNGSPSFQIGDLSEGNGQLLYRDFLQGTGADQQDILWFGSPEEVDCDGERVSACECGLKKTFNVVDVLSNDNGGGDDDDDGDDASIIPIVGGIVGGFAFVGVMVFLALRRNNDQGFEQKPAPQVNHYRPQPQVASSPYASKASMPGSPPPGLDRQNGGAQSLAKGKAVAAQLDF